MKQLLAHKGSNKIEIELINCNSNNTLSISQLFLRETIINLLEVDRNQARKIYKLVIVLNN